MVASKAEVVAVRRLEEAVTVRLLAEAPMAWDAAGGRAVSSSAEVRVALLEMCIRDSPHGTRWMRCARAKEMRR